MQGSPLKGVSTKFEAIESSNMTIPSHVKLVDVGPRDGLQNEKQAVPAAIKIELVHRLQAAGLKEIEVTSFVRIYRNTANTGIE